MFVYIPGDVRYSCTQILLKLSEEDMFTNMLKPVTSVVFPIIILAQQLTGEPLNSHEVPLGWEDACVRSGPRVDWDPAPPPYNWSQSMVQISCRLTHGSLALSDFRTWSNASDAQPIILEILCVNQMDTSLSFPWPFKAPHLIYLQIVNCRIPDFYSEYTRDFSDLRLAFRVLILENVKTTLTMSQMHDRIQNVLNISKDVECFSEKVEKVVWQNVTPTFILDDETPISRTQEVLKDWIRKRQLIPHQCQYKYMQYFDESRNDRFSRPPMHMASEELTAAYPRLRLYNLSHADYDALPKALERWRYSFPSLQYLDLRWNNISDFIFTDYGRVADDAGEIDLRYNNISRLTSENLQTLVDLKTAVINLRNNPLSCDCFTNEYLFRLLRDNPRLAGVGLGDYEYIRNMTCASPERLVGVPFGDVTQEDILCEDTGVPEYVTFIVVVSSLTFLLFFLMFVSFFAFRYRKEITILLYTRCGIVLSKLVGGRKPFDAFISYSSKDDNWVLNTLVRRLESKEKGPAFKLCVHHRDFEVGESIADNVAKSVESSRHTVLVLSRNFAKSEWCIYEFRTAMHQSLMEKRRHMVIILLEDVPKAELEADLRKCLETVTYIQVGDRLFWDKIIYSLSGGVKKRDVKISRKKSVLAAQGM